MPLPLPGPDGTAPCAKCGRARVANDVGRCGVCGDLIAQPRPAGFSLARHGRLIAGVLALAVIVGVVVSIRNVGPLRMGEPTNPPPDRNATLFGGPYGGALVIATLVGAVAGVERFARSRR